MVKGVHFKCRNCRKKFWTEFKLSFGARKNKIAPRILDCLLDEARFYFRCPYCKEGCAVGIGFFINGPPEITQIVDEPHYIG